MYDEVTSRMRYSTAPGQAFPLIVRGCRGKGLGRRLSLYSAGPGMSAFGFAKWVFSKCEAMNNITCIRVLIAF